MNHMTERKMCENIGAMLVGGGVKTPDVWNPIEPQPCCANCGHAHLKYFVDMDRYVCYEIGNQYGEAHCPSKQFYCVLWELREYLS